MLYKQGGKETREVCRNAFGEYKHALPLYLSIVISINCIRSYGGQSDIGLNPPQRVVRSSGTFKTLFRPLFFLFSEMAIDIKRVNRSERAAGD